MTLDGFKAVIWYTSDETASDRWRYAVYLNGTTVSTGHCFTFSYAAYMVENAIHRVSSGAA